MCKLQAPQKPGSASAQSFNSKEVWKEFSDSSFPLTYFESHYNQTFSKVLYDCITVEA